jgi:PAS domain S-box-containing protein
MKPLDRLRDRLEKLFEGISDDPYRTGPLSPSRLEQLRHGRMSGWIWECDRYGNYTWCSPEVTQILGYTPEELIGKPVDQIAFESPTADDLRAAFDKGNPIQEIRAEVHSRDGRSLTLLINALPRTDQEGRQLGYRGAVQVISLPEAPVEEQHTERMAISVPDSKDEIGALTVPRLAPTWGAVPGYIEDDDGIRSTASAETISDMQASFDEKKMIVPIVGQDQTLGVLEFEENELGQPWSEDDRALVEAVAKDLALVLLDVRSRQLTQKALEEMQEADRLKSQFLANISHELRTPLNSIIGFSHVILQGIDGPVTETQNQDLSAIYNAGQHLLGLINNILDVTRIEAGKMELTLSDVDLKETIISVMATAGGLVKNKPIELITDIPDDLPIIKADSIRIRQILLNLVSNATKFTAKGQIGVSARVIKPGTSHQIVIAVFDTGPGIAPEDQEKIFEPFSQVDSAAVRRSGGSGLGLSICRYLVELHGGRIWVDSILGEGSTFAFTLPIETADEELEIKAPVILSIDHETTIFEAYRSPLEELGFQFQQVAWPCELDHITAELRPAAILLNLFLEDHSTWNILANLKTMPISRIIPVIIYSRVNDEIGSVLPPLFALERPISDHSVRNILLQTMRPESGAPDVLMVDDNIPNVTDLRIILDRLGCREIRIAHDTNSAAEELDRQIPDLAIVNLMMENLEGFTVLEALLEQELIEKIPVVVMVPSSPTADDQRILDRGSEALREHTLVGIGEHIDKLKSVVSNLELSNPPD